MKKIKLMLIGILLVVLSGCFPVFVPVDGGGRGGEHEGGGDHRDRGEHEGHH